MPNISLNKHSFDDLASLATGLGDAALQERADELNSLATSGNIASQIPEQSLVLTIKKAWSEIYGPSPTSWPQSLQDAFSTIEAGIGFGSFNSGIISALQNLRVEYMTTPAFETAVAVVAQFIGQNGPMNRATTDLAEQFLQLRLASQSGFVPEGAAQAGMGFIKSPFALMVPMWLAGGAGRLTTAGLLRLGEVLGLAGEAAGALSFAGSVMAEGSAFVGGSEFMVSLSNHEGQEISSFDKLRMNESRVNMLTEISASTLFFLGLKGFGAIGRFAASLMPATETGLAVAKAIGHAAAIGGLASTEELQERMGNQFVGEGLRPLHGRAAAPARQRVSGGEGHPYEDSRSFAERLWRAAFLHGVVQTTNGVIGLNGTESRTNEIFRRAYELVETLKENTSPETIVLTTNGRRYPSNALADIFRPFAMLTADERTGGTKTGGTSKAPKAKSAGGGANEGFVKAGGREVADLLVGGSILLKPFRLIANLITGIFAAARYVDGRSMARKGNTAGAVKYLKKTIALFELMGSPVFAAQAYYEMGEVLMSSNMTDKEKASAAYDAFGKAYQIYTEQFEGTNVQKYWHNARFCRERRADAGRLAITKESIFQQMNDLPIGNGWEITDMEKFGAMTAAFWLNPKNRDRARAEVFGDPPAPGQLPLGLIAVRLISVGKNELAKELMRLPEEKEERTPEKLQQVQDIQSVVHRFFPVVEKSTVMKWLENNGFLGGDPAENMKLIETAQLAVERVAQQFLSKKPEDESFEDKRLRSLFLRKDKKGVQYVTAQGVARVLSDLFKGGREQAIERTELLALPGRSVFDDRSLLEDVEQERIPTSPILMRLIKAAEKKGTGRRTINKWFDDVVGLINSPHFPQEYFVGGVLTEAGVEYAVKQITGEHITARPLAERRGSEEAVQEVQEHVTVVASNAKEALETLVKSGKLRIIPRLKKMVEGEWRVFLRKIMSMQEEAEKENRTEKMVYARLADGRFSFNIIRLESAVEYTEILTQARDIMTRKYEDIAKLDEIDRVTIFDAVTCIIQREVFESRFDSHGRLKVGVVKKAYEEIYLKGKARNGDYGAQTGDTEEEIDIGAENEGPTDEVNLEDFFGGGEDEKK